jgi:hypothetical protein
VLLGTHLLHIAACRHIKFPPQPVLLPVGAYGLWGLVCECAHVQGGLGQRHWAY